MPALCPTCRRSLSEASGAGASGAGAYRPFCSERCRAVDLGSWLDARYRIGSPASEEDLDGGPARDGDGDGSAN